MRKLTDPPIPLGRPLLGEEEVEAVRRVLTSGWITQGPEVEAFEAEFAVFTGAPHACAVSSCTAALHLALLAAGVGPEDEVVAPSYSFIATANSIRYAGAIPVFVDIDFATGNLDAERLAGAIGPRCRAVLAVHQLGMPCDMAAIGEAVAGRVPIIEDAACAAGSELLHAGTWQKIGAPHGLVACFSFHPRKLLSTGDGGMLTTANAPIAERLRRLRQHGMSVNDRARHESGRVVFESYEELGFNYRLTDIQAAIGRVQLRRLPGMVQHRRSLAERYHSALARVAGITPPSEPAWARSNWQTYEVRLARAIDQRAVMEAMLADGIATRRGVMCAHREPAYRTEPWRCTRTSARCDCPPGSCAKLRQSEAAQDHSLMLPIFGEMTISQQDRVIASLSRAVQSTVRVTPSQKIA